MVSTRRSGDLSANNNTTANGSSKRSPPSSSQDKPTSPKRHKLEDAEKAPAAATEEKSKGIGKTPVDSGEAAPIIGEVKVESSPVATAAPPPVAEGSTPATVEKPVRSFSGLSKQLKHYNFDKPLFKLLSQSGQNPNLNIYTSSYTIGSCRTCNFTLKDHTVGALLCKIKKNQREGKTVAVLENTGSKGSVLINGTVVEKNASCVLHSGDEVVFGTLGSYAFIFQQVPEGAVKGNGLQIPGRKFLQIERRAGDSSAVAGASVLASLSNLRRDLSRWKSSSYSSRKSRQAEKPATSVVQDDVELEVDGMEGISTFNNESDKAADSGAVSAQNQDSKIENLDEKRTWQGIHNNLQHQAMVCDVQCSEKTFKLVLLKAKAWKFHLKIFPII